MSRRVSLLLEDSVFERLQTRARAKGSTFSEEVREVLERDLADEDPNAGLRSLVGMVKHLRPGPELGSPEFREAMVRRIERKGDES